MATQTLPTSAASVASQEKALRLFKEKVVEHEGERLMLVAPQITVARLTAESIAAMDPIASYIRARAEEMTPERDREAPDAWWGFITARAAEGSPLGTYALLENGIPVAVGVTTANQHGHGTYYGVDGPWLAAGHVFHAARSRGLHAHLVTARLDALKGAGITQANTGVSPDNKRSLITMIKAGFVPFAIGPTLDPNGTGSMTVFMHWEAQNG